MMTVMIKPLIAVKRLTSRAYRASTSRCSEGKRLLLGTVCTVASPGLTAVAPVAAGKRGSGLPLALSLLLVSLVNAVWFKAFFFLFMFLDNNSFLTRLLPMMSSSLSLHPTTGYCFSFFNGLQEKTHTNRGSLLSKPAKRELC